MERLKAAFEQALLPLSHFQLGFTHHHINLCNIVLFVFKCLNVSLPHGTDPAIRVVHR